jgi:CheY-like chemotaxis protein
MRPFAGLPFGIPNPHKTGRLSCSGVYYRLTPARPKTPVGPMDAPMHSQIVLLVEDSDDDAFFFERALAVAAVPVQLIRVADGGAAVEYLERMTRGSKDLSRTHVLFLDLKLPVLSGFEVMRWIRERNLLLEVIVLSGSDLDSDIEAARDLGASEFLVKPIMAVQLQDRLMPRTRATVSAPTDAA